MPRTTTSQQHPEPESYTKSFPTVDDVLTLLQEATDTLKKVAEHKYPMDVRRASSYRREVIDVGDNQNSIQLKASGRTYFFDFKEIQAGQSAGKSFLRITESRMKGKDGRPEKNNIIIFPEDAKKFATAVAEAMARMTALNMPYHQD